jgi:hypothetical protein
MLARHRFLSAAVAASFALALGFGGCDSSGVGRLVPVQGRVTFDGQPLTAGSLVFKPDAEKGNTSKHEPAANIEADGSYRLFTAEREGAPLGWYKVSVVAQAPADERNPYAATKSLIPARYAEVGTSGLGVEVVDEPSPDAYHLKLSR